MNRKIFLILGPSGSGKTTLGFYLKRIGIPELVSATTRKPREGEINGYNYHFVTLTEFQKLDLIEDVEYSGEHYGTFKSEVTEKLSKYNAIFAVMNIDGVRAMRKEYGDIVKVIYCKCAINTLYKRMLERGNTDSEAKIRIEYLKNNNELDFDNESDLILHTDILNLENCQNITERYIEGQCGGKQWEQ